MTLDKSHLNVADNDLRGGDPLSEKGRQLRLFLTPSEKGPTLGSKSFPFRVDSFSEMDKNDLDMGLL